VARAGLHRSHDLRPLQGLRRVIRAMTEFHGIVNIRIDRNGVPMLRLLRRLVALNVADLPKPPVAEKAP